ncbi:MAG: hypothetical protein UGF43_13755 [Blautia sp.]|uniref:hypothetical protein n=1 Tax=Blautia sp. TaxID=1955243 RepID=UPI002E7A9396|nr:hypothetical protein [Blautia sp.]MEE1444657.1 hypothetical protein [Blautia sp.]
MEHYHLNRKYKDRLFRLIFRDKENLLQLYNAINDSHYTNPEDLMITTIDDIMSLYEHQSTYSPNLPLRGLFYFSAMYRNYIEPMKQQLYTESPFQIPFPVYLVFYNGMKEEPERKEIPLSNLFIQNEKGLQPALECTATLLNINLGHNRELMEKCRILKEYAQFIYMIRSKIASELPFQEAVESAVNECISKGILSEILRKNKTEVIDVILTEYDENEFREFLKENSWKKGHEAGMEEERKNNIRFMIKTCMEFQLPREQILEKLMEGFSLSKDEAEKHLENYKK